MDPFSAEGELLNIHNAFVQGVSASFRNKHCDADCPSNIKK
jgi:hypothetical protein